MPIDPEELKRRREERATQRASRKKKLLLRMGIVAGILVLVALLLAIFLPRDGQTPAPSQTEENAPIQEGQEAESDKKPNTTTIHIALAGDLNITDSIVAAGGANDDYTDVFLDVAHILADADLTALNLEGNLCGAPYGSATMSAPQQLVEALSSAGVDIIQLANSYSINQGISGLASTISGVQAAGMDPLGVYADTAAFKQGKGYILKEVQGVKVAFIAFTKGMDGMALPPGSENCVNLLYEDYESTYQDIDTEGITDIVENASRANPDIIIAMVHWGSEYNDTISRSQKSLTSLLWELGVDAVIGTHSHYLQKFDFNQEEGTFVAYSLGDFLSDSDKSGTQYSVILDLEITKNTRNGRAAISGYSYTPIYTAKEGDSLRILRIEEALAAYDDSFIRRVTSSVYEDMTFALSRIESRIAGE